MKNELKVRSLKVAKSYTLSRLLTLLIYSYSAMQVHVPETE